MSAKTRTTKKTAEVEKKEFNLEQVFTLWINKGKKSGKTYLSGSGENGIKVIGLFNKEKQNPKQPDITLYKKDESGKREKDSICSLWVNASESGKKYAAGKYEGKRVVGFFNSNASVDGVIPYLNVYFSDEQQKAEEEKKAEEPVKAEFEEIPNNEELPF